MSAPRLTHKGRKTAAGGRQIKKQSFTYRPDIDGLRAVAVLAVIVFHYFHNRLPGGFVGVDVFFVISGYLITGLLVHRFETHSYSLLNFYERRIRRIFPALAITLLLTLVAGWFLLFPAEYKVVGKHVAAGAGFVQNLNLLSESGYFDSDATTKPLLHLWSLAVEEQFYIFWPLVLWVVIRCKWPLPRAIALIAILSFALNLWYVETGRHEVAFYNTFARAWELMAGAWLAVADRQQRAGWLKRWPTAQSLIGLGLILFATFATPADAFPGYWALLPVVGSALLINAGPAALVNRHLLSLRPAVFIGLISYPLYLLHWVFLAFLMIGVGTITADNHRALILARIGLVALSILLAWMIYRFAEQPVRDRARGRGTAALALGVGVLGMAGGIIFLANGLPQKPGNLTSKAALPYLETMARDLEAEKCFDLFDPEKPQKPWHCTFGDQQAPTRILLYGDSHALSLLPALDRYGKSTHVAVLFAGAPSCLALKGVATAGTARSCTNFGEATIALAKSQAVSAVILSERWATYGAATGTANAQKIYTRHAPSSTGKKALAAGLSATLDTYRNAGIAALLVEDNPEQPRAVDQARLRFADRNADLSTGINGAAVSLVAHLARQQGVNQLLEKAAPLAGAHVLDLTPALCTAERCPYTIGSKVLYSDNNHPSIAGAMQVYPLLAAELNHILGKKAPAPPIRKP